MKPDLTGIRRLPVCSRSGVVNLAKKFADSSLSIVLICANCTVKIQLFEVGFFDYLRVYRLFAGKCN